VHLGASPEIQEGEERRKISLLGLDELSNLLLLDVCGDVDDAQLVWAVLDNGRNLIARRVCVLIGGGSDVVFGSADGPTRSHSTQVMPTNDVGMRLLTSSRKACVLNVLGLPGPTGCRWSRCYRDHHK